MIIPIRCFTCGRVMADIVDYYENEKANLEETKEDEKEVDKNYKNFDKIHTGKILSATKILWLIRLSGRSGAEVLLR